MNTEMEKKVTSTEKRMTSQQKRRFRRCRHNRPLEPIYEAGLIVIRGKDDNRKVLVVRQDGQVELPKAKQKNDDTLLKTARQAFETMTRLQLPQEASNTPTWTNAISITDFLRMSAYEGIRRRILTFFVVYLNENEHLQNVNHEEVLVKVKQIIELRSGFHSDLAKIIVDLAGSFWVDKPLVEFIRLTWLVDKRNRRGIEKKTISILGKLYTGN